MNVNYTKTDITKLIHYVCTVLDVSIFIEQIITHIY